MLDAAKSIVDFWNEHDSILAIEEMDSIYIYKKGLYVPYTDAKIKHRINYYISDMEKGEEPIKFSTALLHQIKNRLYHDLKNLKDFDKSDWRVNCLNGTVDLRDGSFMPHWKFNETPYKSLIQIPVEYNKDAKCPTITKFIISVFGIHRYQFILEILGYLLYRSNKFQKAFIFFGEASSGKTSFIEMIRIFLGVKNIQDISIQKINQRFQMGNLRNKLANIYDDLPIKKIGYIQNFKQIVTNKTLTGELKGIQDLVTWDNYCKQIYTCNTLPEIGENTGDDFWRRIILIHCTNFFNNGNKDFNIVDKITVKEELSGLLNLCVTNFMKLHERKHFAEEFDNIETVKGIWQINISPLKLFLDTNCTLKENESEESTNFRTQVNAFRKNRNALPISMNLITRRLKDLGIEKKQKSNGKRYYIGIKITKTIIDKIELAILGGQTVL